MDKILVIGDSCEDVFVYGKITKKSPEGMGMVFLSEYKISNSGMTLNVFDNIIGMGGVGTFYSDSGCIKKTRYVDKDTNELYLRVDENDSVDRIEFDDLFYYIPDLLEHDAIIISDYCKGFLCEDDIERISKIHPFVVLDTKKRLGNWCRYVKFIKLNRIEYEYNRDIIYDFPWLSDKVIVTLDSDGAMYRKKVLPVNHVDNPDVSGAGDTFVAGFTLEYLKNNDIYNSIAVANKYACDVVRHKGVTVWNNEL